MLREKTSYLAYVTFYSPRGGLIREAKVPMQELRLIVQGAYACGGQGPLRTQPTGLLTSTERACMHVHDHRV